ncbi:hypothetical protein CR970_02465 [Candidatus Saccharibacteria bacterium]|nr:MAG: hypothetical protein CR970_02465 [Candidatus Saccharibacteria bacterium]
MKNSDFQKPYLVIPKLVEQPTWGGQYIVTQKQWSQHSEMLAKRIGQSYELYSGTNLSLLTDSADPKFVGELTDRDAVESQTRPDNAVALSDLLAADTLSVLGQEHLDQRGDTFGLLIKLTEALGNSFQVHIKSDQQHPKWLPKPEAWYYFEPGLITLGVKPDADWDAYKQSLQTIQDTMMNISRAMTAGNLTYAEAQTQVADLLAQQDPWQYVNTVRVKADDLVDLSCGGLHHSWEEDSALAPKGNILYELQSEALDKVSTFRAFDKGKIGPSGEVRDVHLDEYFEFIDRSPETNDPQSHLKAPERLAATDAYTYDKLLDSPSFCLDKLSLSQSGATFTERVNRYKHFYAQSGSFRIATQHGSVTVTTAHSCFLPAKAETYTITSIADDTQILVSY